MGNCYLNGDSILTHSLHPAQTFTLLIYTITMQEREHSLLHAISIILNTSLQDWRWCLSYGISVPR